ncbi:PREDICTED: uncharacterized protein LOC109583018 [Amphimedon queenslandica]|nr:PREDICTED: uncharacterized protein LOC109583018 [Amphimedon queenslandica]|eukprot:XP_019853716.1 PREDICTED: uncharacterized protein LOC109583018 [Amphimedon queenslandica]
MSNDTLCIKPTDFSSLFSMIDFGLIIHSFMINASHVSYNNFIQLLPGNDVYNTALSLGFSRHTANKVGLLHSVKMTIFDTSFVTQAILNNSQLSFIATINISNSHFYMSHIHGLANINRQWKNLIVNVTGFFMNKSGLFMNELERSVVEEIRRLGIAANVRKTEADKQLANAVARLVGARNQLMLARESVTNSTLKLNETMDSLQRARNQLREAEMNVTSATSEVKEAEEAINIVCQRITCPLECKNASRKRTVYEDTYYTAEGTCDSVCNSTIRVRVSPYFEPYISWQYIVCCWDVEVPCGIQSLCETKVCSPVCKFLNSTRPVFNYMLQDIQIPCKVPCPVRQYNTTIERTEEFIDPCGKRVPNLNCTQTSSACDSEREASLRALNKKRRDLVAPLQERNRARNYVLLLEVRENEVANELVLAQESLKSAETFYRASVIYKNAVEASYNTTLELIRNDQNLYNLIQVYGTKVFNITNITFSVSISEINNPSVFPITIGYSIPGESDLQLIYVYQFGQNYSSQKQYIVNDIIDNIFNLPRRRRRQMEGLGESGREQFEIRCSQLNSIDKFVQYMINTLDEVELKGMTIQKNLLDVIVSINMTLNATSISNVSITGNFTSLKVLYGLTDEDIEQSRQEVSNMDDEVFNSVQSSYKTLQSEALMVLNSLNVTLLMQWRSGIESLLQGNGTVAGKPCSGLVDCILVSNSALDSLISFAPSNTSSVLLQHLPSASQLFLQLATDELLSFSEVRDKLAPMNSIIQEMISNGYWCSTPPVIISHPVAKINVQIGTELVLNCAGNSSLPIIYQWKKDGVALPNTNSHKLMLGNMQVFDEGNYSCEVTNNVGSLQSTNSSVHIFILPQFFQVPSSVITYLGDGNGAYFTCNATSRPDPGWKWYHRSAVNRPWREIIGEETNELLIRNPSSSDKGEYRCLAYNDFGNLSSNPVSLRLISVTAKVLAYNIDISMKELNNTELLMTNISVEDQIRSQFKDAVLFGNVTLSQISMREVLIDELLVSFKLIGHNVTTISAADTTPLQVIVANLATSTQELDRVRDELKTYLEKSENFKLEYKDSKYQYSANSFDLDMPEIQCPPGQELYSNRFLCSDCLEGQEQIMKTESRFTIGRVITERVPRCSPCPLNTYQNIGGSGQCKPCPINHITFITGAVSVEQCIELCSVNHYSPNGLMPCRPCLIGTYQPQTGQIECLPCFSEVDDPLCSKNPCEQPMVIGSCSEKQLKFYYDKSSQQCQPFIYSGCDGSENNFNSLNECSQKCGCPQNESIITECDADPCLSSSCLSAPTAQCFSDNCSNCTSRYYYNDQEVTDTCSCNNGLVPVSCSSPCLPTCQIPEPVCSPSLSCIPGCGCPDDTVYDQTKQTCVTPLSCDTCSLPPNPGTCHGIFPRWFYNASSERCELFNYGGCAGNNNRFTSLQECIQSCGCGSNDVSVTCTSDLCETSSCEAHSNSVCEVDSCSNCTVKHYVGLKEVTNQCDICALPPDSGNCNGSFNRWYFNKASGHCELFAYGGCHGNGNNFKSLNTCLQKCASGDKLCDESVTSVECYSDPCVTTHCPNYDNAVCIPNHCGECSAHYYNSTGHDITMMCSDCPPEQPAAKCLINLCDHKTCPNLPPTQCLLDVCGECKARYLWNNVDVTEFCMTCPAQGQIFKDCGGSCERTCSDILSQKPFVCSKHYCIPGCACPAGQVLDEGNNKCVYPEQCPCQRSCDPMPENCTRIYYDNCNCPLCRDCPITGQEYNEVSAYCPKTCSNPHLLCAGEGQPGCSCPLGQVIDEMNNRCVQLKDCPKPDPCTLAPERGPCTASITRYHYNVTSQTCEQFSYGGCFPNENNFFTKHDCEEKCSDCYPVCTPEYCAIKRGGTCSVPSSPPGSTQGCPGGCAISNCGACYYSYNDLPFPPLPGSCPSVCPFVNGQVDESCMARWGRCVQRSYFNIYKSVSEREQFKENFRCWSHQCTN